MKHDKLKHLVTSNGFIMIKKNVFANNGKNNRQLYF